MDYTRGVSVMTRLRDFLSGPRPDHPLASRHERRAVARERHHETGEPAWSDADRHTDPDGEVWVADVAPGTPGHDASVHTARRD